MRQALERYNVDSARIAQYEPLQKGETPVLDAMKPDKAYRVFQQNREIDRAMARLAIIDPRVSYPIVHLYYRRGFWDQANGWEEVSRRAGLNRSLGRDCSRPVFDLLLTQALELLYFAHQQRGRNER
jgi:hypothetical protein